MVKITIGLKKIIYNERKLNWFNFEPKALGYILRSIGIAPLPIDETFYLNSYKKKSDSSIIDINENYLGIRLYDLSIYSICNDLIIFKDELILESHHETIHKWFTISKTILSDFNEIFSKNKFSSVLVINGHSLVDACLLAFAKKNNVPFLTIENTSNSKKVVWDNITGKVVTYNLAKNYFFKFKNYVDIEIAENYVANFKETIFKNKKEEHLSNVNNLDVPFKKPYILFLGQVYSDAAQLFAVEGEFKNPVEIINETVKICKNLNIPLVIKLHPKENEGISPVVEKAYDSPTYKRIKKYNSENVYIDYSNTYNTYKLIEESLLVVTLNSQAGLEASLYNKPIIVYKNCFFSGLGFTYEYKTRQELKSNIEYLLRNDISNNKNLVLAQKFFFIFFEKYCFENTVINLTSRILKTGSYSKIEFLKFRYINFIIAIKKYLARILKN